jgi:hypothetical protein
MKSLSQILGIPILETVVIECTSDLIIDWFRSAKSLNNLAIDIHNEYVQNFADTYNISFEAAEYLCTPYKQKQKVYKT